ncbi:MAG: hypothetical protein WC830_06040 [Burkholderiales bacterium]
MMDWQIYESVATTHRLPAAAGGGLGEAPNDSAAASVQAAVTTLRRRSRPYSDGDGTNLVSDALLLPGIGCASVSKNGETVIELQGLAGEFAMTVGDAERLAQAEPAQEWCIHLTGLLDDRHYRREGPGLWRLYSRGYGLS